MSVYYNENDPFAAQWLRNLIAAGHLPAGHVDERSITDVEPSDLDGFTQHHFFAGIGGWPLALRLAGWRDAEPVWTGSPPCQDASIAAEIHNRRTGLDGHRTGLASAWLGLVERVGPYRVLFENVPGLSRWIEEITARFEGAGYRVSRYSRSSAAAGSLHQRRRLWLAADTAESGLEKPWLAPSPAHASRPWVEPARYAADAVARLDSSMDAGVSNRVATVRAAGNAIDPHVAASVIKEWVGMMSNERPEAETEAG